MLLDSREVEGGGGVNPPKTVRERDSAPLSGGVPMNGVLLGVETELSGGEVTIEHPGEEGAVVIGVSPIT